MVPLLGCADAQYHTFNGTIKLIYKSKKTQKTLVPFNHPHEDQSRHTLRARAARVGSELQKSFLYKIA